MACCRRLGNALFDDGGGDTTDVATVTAVAVLNAVVVVAAVAAATEIVIVRGTRVMIGCVKDVLIGRRNRLCLL
eukprot:6617119-Ditylum_brightwellii.AAC.1